MKLKHIYTIIVALLLFTGCAENEIYEDVNGTSHELVPLRFNIPAMAEVETRGISLPENETMVGETVGIFMLTEEEYKYLLEGSIKYVGNDAQKDGKTVTYDYYHNLHKIEGYVVKHNVQFCVEEDGSLNAVNGDSLFYSTTGGTAVFAYSPYDPEMTKEKLFQSVVSVSDDQITNENVLDNYFRLGTPVRGDKTSGNPIVSYQRSISLHFRHQLSRIVLKTSFGDLKEMCWDKDKAEDVDRIVVCVDNVPVSGKRTLAKDGLNYAYSEHTLGLVSMASYSLSQSEVPDSIYPNVLVVPTENKVVPRFKLFFYKGEDLLKVVGLTVRNGQGNVTLGVGTSLNFNCTYSEEDKLRDAFARNLDYTLEDNIELSEPLVLDEGKEVVLNLNGYSITQTMKCSASYSMIVNKGSLTIKDSLVTKNEDSEITIPDNGRLDPLTLRTLSGKISFTDAGSGDPNFGWGSYTLMNYGTLVVEGGTLENCSQQNAENTVKHMYCVIQQASGRTTVNGGSIINKTYRSIRVNGGSLTVNGGTMTGQVWLQPNQSNAELKVTGGEFSPSGVDGSSIFMENAGEGIIGSSAEITGGKFNTKIGSSMPGKDGVKGCVTGGTFTETAMQNTNKNLFAEETYLVKNDEGNYIVKHSTDEKQDLLTAFRNGGEYQLEEDVILIHPLTLAKGKALVLDLNGHSITHETFPPLTPKRNPRERVESDQGLPGKQRGCVSGLPDLEGDRGSFRVTPKLLSRWRWRQLEGLGNRRSF